MLKTDDIKNYSKLAELDKKKLQQKFHEDDLNYLASFAIESNNISLTDIEDLNSRIDAKAKNGFNKSHLNTFAALVCGIFIGATAFFGWLESTKNHETLYAVVNEKPLSKEITPPPPPPSAPNEIVSPEKVKTEYHKEHFSITHSAEQITNEVEMPETIETKTLSGLNTTPVDNNEINLRYLPNAPVIFIKDLKVANYNLYYFKNNQSIDLQTGLSAEFSNKYERENGVLTKNPDINYYAHQMIKDAITNFSIKNYSGCISLLDPLYKYNKRDVNCQFYLGMSYYYLGSYTKAQLLFEKVLENDINIFEQESEFYKAMCFYNNGQKEESKDLLKWISGRKGFYAERANEFLKKAE